MISSLVGKSDENNHVVLFLICQVRVTEILAVRFQVLLIIYTRDKRKKEHMKNKEITKVRSNLIYNI